MAMNKNSQTFGPEPKKLYRSRIDRMIAGVCGGVAEYLNMDVTIVRVIWVITCFIGGFGVIAYLAGLIIIPENPEQEKVALKEFKERKTGKNTNLIWGIILILIGLVFMSRNFDFYFPPFHSPWWPHFFRWDVFWPLVLILIGVVYLIHVLKKEESPVERPKTEEGITIGKKFTRSTTQKMIAGVCGGIATYFNIDVSIIRIAWILLTIFGGFFLGILAYIVLVIAIPEEKELATPAKVTPKRTTSNQGEN